MKKYIIISLLLFIPFLAMAADHCTNPSEYTIDKRCYVTDEQKKESPYNAVVGFIGYYGDINCTGTIVKQNDQMFVYTAKHCMGGQKERMVSFVDETKARVIVFSEGNYKTSFSLHGEIRTDEDGDWAILKFDENDIKKMPFVELSSYPNNQNALSVGYGGLKVMSDNEIEDIKTKYINYWKDHDSPYVIEDKNSGEYVPEGKILITQENQSRYGLNDGGISTLNSYVKHFMNTIDFYSLYNNDHNNLKVSYCQYNPNSNEAIGCQGWQGDSGGGLFDSKGNLIAIRSKGSAIVGGLNHASNKDTDGYITVKTTTK